MKKQVKVLMVDDHPIILDGYMNILNGSIGNELNIVIESANTCKEACSKVTASIESIPYDIIYLDISLPPAIDLKIYSGEDLGMKIREISPSSKIIVMTMHTENVRIHNLMKNLNPEGLLIKSDVTPKEFLAAFEKVLEDDWYYSQTVNEMLRKRFTSNFNFDEIDRSILYHLSIGVRTKDLEEIIPLSLPALEKRKRLIKEALGVESGGDLVLIEKAKEFGFI